MGAENVPANMEVNYYKWKSWIAALREDDDCVAVKLENAARELQKNVDVQTEGKWGVGVMVKGLMGAGMSMKGPTVPRSKSKNACSTSPSRSGSSVVGTVSPLLVIH